MIPDNGILNFQTIFLSKDESEQVEELIQEADTDPFLNMNGILYRYDTVTNGKNSYKILTPLGFACEVSKQIEMLDDDKKYIEFTFSKNGMDKIEIMPREVLLAKNVSKLYSKGYSYNQTNKLDTELANYLTISEQSAKYAYRHKTVGVMEIDGKKVFALDKIVGHLESEYIGILNLKPCGEYNIWLDLIKNSIVGRTGLEFALNCGFAAMILNFLPEVNQSECIFANIGGSLKSSTGKTSGLVVGASIAGNPSIQGGRLVNSWRSTDSALPALCRFNRGVMVCFDEYSLREHKENIDFLYLFSQGIRKEGCSPDGELRKNFPFCTLILSSSEISILSAARSVKEGQLHRCLEFGKGFDFTDSETHSDHIKSILTNNYGHAAPIFAKYLIDNQDQLPRYYEAVKRYFRKILRTDDRLKLRVSKRYTFIFLAGYLANRVFGLRMNIKKLMKLSATNIHEYFNEVGEEERALRILFDYVGLATSKYPNKADYPKKHKFNDIHGFIETNKNSIYTQLVIATEKFREVMKQNGFEDSDKIISLLKAKGFLNFEKGKNYRTRKLGGTTAVRCYVITMDNIAGTTFNKEQDKTVSVVKKKEATIIDVPDEELKLNF